MFYYGLNRPLKERLKVTTGLQASGHHWCKYFVTIVGF